MYIFLKGNIKLIKHGALLILRPEIVSFLHPCCLVLTACAKRIQTEADIISDDHLFLDRRALMENMKQERVPVSERG